MTIDSCNGIRFILFDFGGVLAEEGFLGGLQDISRTFGVAPETFRKTAVELAFEGYVGGRTTEAQYWQALRQRFDLKATDEELRRMLLDQFIVRPWMLRIVDRLVECGLTTAILSDQTNWLDELDAMHGIYRHFHKIFNSWRTGYSKRQPESFFHALDQLGAQASESLFIDDSRSNVAMAKKLGFQTIHFEYDNPKDFLPEMLEYCPCLENIMPELKD